MKHLNKMLEVTKEIQGIFCVFFYNRDRDIQTVYICQHMDLQTIVSAYSVNTLHFRLYHGHSSHPMVLREILQHDR